MPSNYEFPKQTGNLETDVRNLFRAVYKIAQNLNIDLAEIEKKLKDKEE